MKKLLLGLTGSLALFAGNAAQAADLPVEAPGMAPAYVAPVSNWTGFYLGINGGYGWNNNTGDLFCVTPAPGSVVAGPGCSPSIASTLKPQGGLFGGQAGFNYQSGIV